MTRIALLGDYREEVTAHRAIPQALRLCAERLGGSLSWEWVGTDRVRDASGDLAGFSALWAVPASPYRNPDGVFAAIRWAREGGRPFLGTCGGFQHALIEFARNVAGIPDAEHAETAPGAASRLVAPLSCSLLETTGCVHFLEGSLIGSAYGSPSATEGYRCSYGLNAAYRPPMERAGLRFSAWDDSGDVRGAELGGAAFYAGVLFQPERAALRGEVPPLVLAFTRAAARAP